MRALQSIHDGGAYHGRIEDAIRIGKDDGKVFVASSVAYRGEIDIFCNSLLPFLDIEILLILDRCHIF